eukprot:m.62727 g.62727  ORF g.62727 m.62727 type:complete len:230 (-) comp11530_c0_seq3:213-902(-)
MADANAWKNSSGPKQAALLAAVETDKPEEVRKLLEENADPNLPRTPSDLGCHPCWLGFVVFHALIQGPLEYASMRALPDIIGLLVDAGADVNNERANALQYIVQNYAYEELRQFTLDSMDAILTRENHITNRNILGGALTFSGAHGHVEVVGKLLECGADPNYYRPEDDYYITPLVNLIFENEQEPGHVQIAQMLIARGARKDHQARMRTALDYAKEYEREDLIPILSE